MKLTRKEKIEKLTAISSGKVSVADAFPEDIFLSLFTAWELNFLLNAKRKYQGNLELCTGEEQHKIRGINKNYTRRRKQLTRKEVALFAKRHPGHGESLEERNEIDKISERIRGPFFDSIDSRNNCYSSTL